MSNGASFAEVFYQDEDVKSVIELCVVPEGKALFLHCEVYNWSKETLKKCRKEFQELKKLAKEHGCDSVYTYTENPRWCHLLEKCEKIGEFEEDGKKYEVLEWELEQEH